MLKKITLLLTVTLTLLSCSSDDKNETPIIIPEYAMTAKINGVSFQANNPFGTNDFSETNIWSYFPIEDYVMLQGRQGGLLGYPEINIWLKRDDIRIDTFVIGQDTFETPSSHFIRLVDFSIDESTDTKEGIIQITEINTVAKTIRGTFQFKTLTSIFDPEVTINYDITEGTFNYKYE